MGAGGAGDILNNVNADMIITGEFSHHEILHEVHRGVSVIVTDHSNTERGYAHLFKDRFIQLLKSKNVDYLKCGLEILISQVDRDPLQYI